MRRMWGALGVAAVGATVLVACGSHTPSPTKPSPSNAPPVIQSIQLSDTRVEVGSSVTLSATVTDAETPVNALTYDWSAPSGTFSGTGSSVTWKPAADAETPADVVLTLKVTENYTSGSQPQTNIASKTISVHVNNSPKELAALSMRFLSNFGDSSVSPETCVAEFSDSCAGKSAELADITDNRHDFLILDSTLHPTAVDIEPSRTDATVHTFCSFTSRVITHSPQSGGCKADPASCTYDSVQTVSGDCYTTNVYQAGQWRLCTSHFASHGPLTSFGRAFFGIRATGR